LSRNGKPWEGAPLTMNRLSQMAEIPSLKACESCCKHYAFSLTLTLSRWEREKRLPRLGKQAALWFMGAMREFIGGNLALTLSPRGERGMLLEARQEASVGLVGKERC